MKWNHILENSPEEGESIIQLNPPYLGHSAMGMRTWDCSKDAWKSCLEYYQLQGTDLPNFWWISVKDFPFPFDINHYVT